MEEGKEVEKDGVGAPFAFSLALDEALEGSREEAEIDALGIWVVRLLPRAAQRGTTVSSIGAKRAMQGCVASCGSGIDSLRDGHHAQAVVLPPA